MSSRFEANGAPFDEAAQTPEELPIDPRARRLARIITWSSGIAFWGVVLLLASAVGVDLVDAVLLSFLLVVVPGLAVAQVPLIGETEIVRMPAYIGSIVTLWMIGTACWLVGTRAAGPEAIGLVGMPILPLVGWSVALTLGVLVIVVAFRQLAVLLKLPETRMLRELLPRTRKEEQTFALLSVAAGSGEEIAYRGYAIPMLAPILGVPGAAVLTSMVFGVLHSYQGWIGIARTGLMGGFLAWGFLASGSLWPPIVAHTVFDLIAGLVLRDWLEPPIGDRGVLASTSSTSSTASPSSCDRPPTPID